MAWIIEVLGVEDIYGAVLDDGEQKHLTILESLLSITRFSDRRLEFALQLMAIVESLGGSPVFRVFQSPRSNLMAQKHFKRPL